MQLAILIAFSVNTYILKACGFEEDILEMHDMSRLCGM